MGSSVGLFLPGETVVTIDFPVSSTATANSEFILQGAATDQGGQVNPEGVQGGNVSEAPGLLSASGEWVASVTRASTQKYDFTFSAPVDSGSVTPSDFSLYTASDASFVGSAATVSGQTVQVTFPGVTASKHIVDGTMLPGAITSSGVPTTAGQEPIGLPAGDFTGTNANRGVAYQPGYPSKSQKMMDAPKTLTDAPCAPGDSPETGLQGTVPASVRSAGFKGFSCNLKELSQWPAKGTTWDGGTWVGAWAGNCAYLSTQGHGVYVINVSNPNDPVETELLTTPAFLHTWESLKYNPARHLLAATSYQDPYFDIYNVSNCADPVLDGSIDMGANNAEHAGNWAANGDTYYGTENYRGIGSTLTAINTTNPTDPTLIGNVVMPGTFGDAGRPHDISTNPSGTIAYIQQPGQFGNNDFVTAENGLVIANIAQIAHRVANPKVTIDSALFWNNGGQGQQSLPVTYNGVPYVITTDEVGSGGVGGRAGACARGLSPFGFPNIVNVSNPKDPFVVSTLYLEADSPTKCAVNDDTPNTGSFGYDQHYCNVNRTNDPTMLGCAEFEGGLRVYDIANPAKPKEIAYYNPSPGLGTDSQQATSEPVGFTETDWASSPPVFVGCNIWDQFQDNGYLFLHIEHGPAASLCKSDPKTANSSLQ